ncbi:MAG TPA: PadR family transcriptional regulator [Longimicrobium sp.]|jgi:transcriptional regulator
MATEPLNLLQGTLDLLILRALAWTPMHGYGVTQWLRERTDEALTVQDAALYQALRRMEGKGWVEAEWRTSENNRRARYYALTQAGRQQLGREAATWRRYAQAVFQVLEPMPGEA